MRAVLLLLLAACGDNLVAPDARLPDAVDAAPDGPPPPPGCDWGEQLDTANDPTPEPTGLPFASRLVMCGQIDPGHEIPSQMLVDADAFGFTLPTERALRVELAGDLGALDVELSIVNRFGDPLATSRFVGAHAVAVARLPAGSYGVAVRARGTAPAAPIAYTATITVDTSTCDVATSTYTESANDNDVVEVRFTSDPRRAMTTGTPEPTGFVLGAPVRLTGTSADVDAADEYRDRDTYAFQTGAVDTLTVKLDWTGAADLDLLVFPANTLPELAGATHISTTGPETATLAVAPNTTYWLWIGSYDTSTNLPVSYDATLCAE